ncbi:MAG: hypothetical protein AMJ95_11875, partial [Omnitrophica WOR_2 bacterium SM23_72]
MKRNITGDFLKNPLFSNERLFLILLLSVSFMIRVTLFRYRSLPEGDGCHYVSYAKDFMRGDFSLFGTGLIAVSYFFAKRFFNQIVARYTALLIAVNLYLINFSTYCFTEGPYVLLIMLTVFLGWVSLEKQKKRYYFLLGALLGFSYTIRNEVMVFVLIFLGMMVWRNYKKAWLHMTMLLLGLALFIAPLVLFYRHQYGIWTLGDKGSVNFWLGEDVSSYRVFSELTDDFSGYLFVKSGSDELQRNGLFAYLYKNKFFISRLALNYKRV